MKWWSRYTAVSYTHLKGAADWQIGKRVCKIRKGDIIAVNNVEPRKFLYVDKGERFECEIFAFLPTIFSQATNCLRLFYDRSPDFDPVIGSDMPFTKEVNFMLDMLVKGFEDSDSPESSSLVLGLLTAVVSMLIKSVEQSFPGTLGRAEHSSHLAAEIIVGAIQYINDNISSKFGVTELAGHMNLSRGYFSQIFRRYTGSSPSEFINRCRITNVIYLINCGKMNILSAAMESGFGSASGFYKTFHAVCGSSPREYLDWKVSEGH